MNTLNIPIDLNQLLLFLKQQLPFSERKKLAKLLAKEETENSPAEKKKVCFTVLHTDVKKYKFNRDEANQR